MSAAEVLWELDSAGVELGAVGDRVRLVAPPGRLSAILTPAFRDEVAQVRPLLVLVAGGRWREQVEGWPAWWRGCWAEKAAANQSAGLAPELSGELAFLYVAELPDEAAPAPAAASGPASAPCPACGLLGEVAASGLGFCEGCGWVPRLEWDWS